MTPVDADFPDHERQAMLDEVRDYLPGFLSNAATMRRAMLNDIKLLLDLDSSDLDNLVSVHAALCEEVEALAPRLDHGTRRPWSGSTPELLTTRRPNGAVDWLATTGRRAQAGNDPTLFAMRASRTATDVAENRMLVWVVHELARRVARARRATYSPSNEDVAQWRARLDALHQTLAPIVRRSWIAGADPAAPRLDDLQRVSRSRSPFHRGEVLAAARALRRANEPSPDAITRILCRAYFEPNKTADLFELVVALRLMRELNDPKHGLTPRPARLVRGAHRADEYATYDLPGGGTISVLFQRWPAESGRSVRKQLADAHGLTAHGYRPDIVLVRRSGTTPAVLTDVLVIEVKASRDPSYLNQGLGQLLAYRGDYPHLFPHVPSGWLVAPPRNAFANAPQTAGSPLWIIDHDRLAEAAVARIVA